MTSIRVSIQMLIIALLCLFLFAENVWSCELEPHGFARVAAGWTGDINDPANQANGSGDLAAQIELGMRFPFTTDHWISFKLTHDSFWFDGDDNKGIEHFNIGYEYRF